MGAGASQPQPEAPVAQALRRSALPRQQSLFSIPVPPQAFGDQPEAPTDEEMRLQRKREVARRWRLAAKAVRMRQRLEEVGKEEGARLAELARSHSLARILKAPQHKPSVKLMLQDLKFKPKRAVALQDLLEASDSPEQRMKIAELGGIPLLARLGRDPEIGRSRAVVLALLRNLTRDSALLAQKAVVDAIRIGEMMALVERREPGSSLAAAAALRPPYSLIPSRETKADRKTEGPGQLGPGAPEAAVVLNLTALDAIVKRYVAEGYHNVLYEHLSNPFIQNQYRETPAAVLTNLCRLVPPPPPPPTPPTPPRVEAVHKFLNEKGELPKFVRQLLTHPSARIRLSGARCAFHLSKNFHMVQALFKARVLEVLIPVAVPPAAEGEETGGVAAAAPAGKADGGGGEGGSGSSPDAQLLGEVQAEALRALAVFSDYAESHDVLVRRAIAGLVRLSKRPNPLFARSVAYVVASLARNGKYRERVADEGAMFLLLPYASQEPKSAEDVKIKEACVAALWPDEARKKQQRILDGLRASAANNRRLVQEAEERMRMEEASELEPPLKLKPLTLLSSSLFKLFSSSLLIVLSGNRTVLFVLLRERTPIPRTKPRDRWRRVLQLLREHWAQERLNREVGEGKVVELLQERADEYRSMLHMEEDARQAELAARRARAINADGAAAGRAGARRASSITSFAEYRSASLPGRTKGGALSPRPAVPSTEPSPSRRLRKRPTAVESQPAAVFRGSTRMEEMARAASRVGPRDQPPSPPPQPGPDPFQQFVVNPFLSHRGPPQGGIPHGQRLAPAPGPAPAPALAPHPPSGPPGLRFPSLPHTAAPSVLARVLAPDDPLGLHPESWLQLKAPPPALSSSGRSPRDASPMRQRPAAADGDREGRPSGLRVDREAIWEGVTWRGLGARDRVQGGTFDPAAPNSPRPPDAPAPPAPHGQPQPPPARGPKADPAGSVPASPRSLGPFAAGRRARVEEIKLRARGDPAGLAPPARVLA
eukprot:tig00020710_g13259.t1